MRDYPWRQRRRSEAAGNGRPKAEAGATGGGLWGWVRRHIIGSFIGAALITALTAWLGAFLHAALNNIAPPGAETFCALRESITNDPPPAADRFRILIATIDGDDSDKKYTRHIDSTFFNRQGIDRVPTCRILRVSGGEEQIRAAATARDWLDRRHADLLIGGQLLKDRLHIWFIGKQDKNFQTAYFDPKDLKEDFASTQLLVIALTAVAPATEQQGRYLVEILRPITERLKSLLQDAEGFSKEQRAELHHALGLGLLAVGEQSGQSQDLVDAAAAFRAALTERTRERVPLDWAMTQNNFGNALWSLGQRASGTARLKEAVEAYRAALQEWTRERVPLQWATVQNNLGTALRSLGERESGTAPLEEAVAAYRAALAEQTRERVPLQWAATQNNLGLALQRLGERESGTVRLEEAVAAYRAALSELTRERVPLDWATVQNNLGNALRRLGERESGTARLLEAVDACRAALTERTRERVPLDWAFSQHGLAAVFYVLAARADGDARLAHLRDALASVDDALAVYREGKAAYYITMANPLRAAILAEQQKRQN